MNSRLRDEPPQDALLGLSANHNTEDDQDLETPPVPSQAMETSDREMHHTQSGSETRHDGDAVSAPRHAGQILALKGLPVVSISHYTENSRTGHHEESDMMAPLAPTTGTESHPSRHQDSWTSDVPGSATAPSPIPKDAASENSKETRASQEVES
jgi:hypothetical protein